MSNELDSPDVRKGLLINILEYIQEQTKKIELSDFDLDRHKGFKLYSEGLNPLPGVEFNIPKVGDHIWLKVERLKKTPPPTLPVDCNGFISFYTDPFLSPAIDEEKIRISVVDRIQKLRDCAEFEEDEDINTRVAQAIALKSQNIENSFKLYLPQWLEWSRNQKLTYTTIRLYADLFALRSQIESEQAIKPQELVWGIGIAKWTIEGEGGKFSFKYPLFTQGIDITLDPETGVIELRAKDTAAVPEFDALIFSNIPHALETEKEIKRILKESEDRQDSSTLNPFEPSTYDHFLQMVAAALDPNGRFVRSRTLKEEVGASVKSLIVTDEWVLFSRLKTVNSIRTDVTALKEAVDRCESIPLGPEMFVSVPGDKNATYQEINFRGVSSRGSGSGGGGGVAGLRAKDLYFPLPYNQEQLTIIKMLETSPGVVCQGPPGTGKTHTIVNIICHYLATGRRVLVSSKGENALSVLKSLIPPSIQPLTVALLNNDREALRDFSGAISAIQHELSQLNPFETKKQIEIIRGAIDLAHEELAKIDGRIDEIAHEQLQNYNIGEKKLRPQELAALVVEGKERFSWFLDKIGFDQNPPLDAIESRFLREARRRVGENLSYVGLMLPDPHNLPSIEQLAELHRNLSSFNQLLEDQKSGKLVCLINSSSEVMDRVNEFIPILDQAHEKVRQVEMSNHEWAWELRKKIKNRVFSDAVEALISLFPCFETISKARREFLKNPVELPSTAIHNKKAIEAIDQAVRTGKPFGLLSFGSANAKAKEEIESIRVSGLAPSSMTQWQHVQRYVLLHVELITFVSRWNPIASELELPALDIGDFDLGVLKKIDSITTTISLIHSICVDDDLKVEQYVQWTVLQVPWDGDYQESTGIEVLRSHLRRHLMRHQLEGAVIQKNQVLDHLSSCQGAVSERFWGFFETHVGSLDLTADQVCTEFTQILNELRQVTSAKNDLSEIDRLTAIIRDAGGEEFCRALRSNPSPEHGDDQVFPMHWEEAWNWARIKGFFENINCRSELVDLFEKRVAHELTLSRLYKEIVRLSAWLSTAENCTPRVRSGLAAFGNAIKNLGKETGPKAPMYRRHARSAMKDARDAVPCWIMNHYAVSSHLPSDLGAFDLVIVDEASQSDLYAIPTILRGNKVLIVGDDKQVSPEAGFVATEFIQQLFDRFLHNQPFKEELIPGKSLYDMAERIFASNQVMLREHFRCVPSIIGYSNQNYYKNQIKPLRIARASERIDPPMVDVLISNGVRSRLDINEGEAAFIAHEIAEIIKNPAFKKRTIGVVSLLGGEQARRIDTLVREICSPYAAELHSRKFECGDARNFQGSERDIMFLSMVADKNDCHALSGKQFEQRFNVAASRARDRMYLVRSVKFEDLSELDLRRGLLEHFDKCLSADISTPEELLKLCQSGFEKEVFTTLLEMGYKVIPQVKSGAYAIDLVVEGEDDRRLAIELDGDDYHGPDRWASDMLRQRILERAGWTFWRCFASTWTLRKESVLTDLIQKLTELEITPLGKEFTIAREVEKRTWEYVEPESESRELLKKEVSKKKKPIELE